ncbi:aldolase [Pendulispora albinea]|uniref:Deoxyribose-phosphate aldolase n=1 Tax=Pendulispora albinea TaxID=2741071 RepID=A0ABZ2LWC6_9BACT
MLREELPLLLETRARRPHRIAEVAAARPRRPALVGESGRLFIIAADHPARGALRIGDDPLAMSNRFDMLERLCTALARPGVDGVLGTADVLEDLLLLGALDGKLAIGSMNRGGLAGASFEIDDRFTGYDAKTISDMGFDGGKMLLRIDRNDPASVVTLDACAKAVGELADQKRMAMVEPFMSTRVDGKVKNILTTEACIHAIAIASGLGRTSAYTWLKVPVVDDMERVMASSTLPALLLGGEGGGDPDAAFERWSRALRLPTVRGLVVGRTLLYPPDGDVAKAVDTAAKLLPGQP